MPEDHRLAPYPSLPNPTTRQSLYQYLEGNLPHGWSVDFLEFSGACPLLVTDAPLRLGVVKDDTLPDGKSFREIFGEADETVDLTAFLDAVAVTCMPILKSGHPSGTQSHRQKNPQQYDRHCVKAYLPSNRSETVLDEKETEDQLREEDLLMGVVNGAFRYEATGNAAPSKAPASEQSGTPGDSNQLQLSELGK
ncbi:hypothetical protein [Salinibaculum rarum]|uniref:hypothetical protein n=1 Tax=Salinibaculum rarum TaxID=3058903 RepID=UPI00265DFE07|nr:hypothetical protein [Salinibaculum sp. KK48]